MGGLSVETKPPQQETPQDSSVRAERLRRHPYVPSGAKLFTAGRGSCGGGQRMSRAGASGLSGQHLC